MPVPTAVVGDALVPARLAGLEVAAEGSGATGGDRPHDAPLRTRQRALVPGTIGIPVAAEDIRHFELRTLHGERGSEVLGRPGRFGRWQGMGQEIQGAAGSADLGGGQAQIARRGRKTSMPQQELDSAQIGAVLEQVAREGVSQAVGRDWLGKARVTSFLRTDFSSG